MCCDDVCFIVRQEKPALTKVSHHEKFGNNIALRHSSPSCLLLIYVSGLPCSFARTLNLIHTEAEAKRDLTSKSPFFFFFFRFRKVNLGQFLVFTVHSKAPSTLGMSPVGGQDLSHWLVLLARKRMGNNSMEWDGISGFESRHRLLRYGLKTGVYTELRQNTHQLSPAPYGGCKRHMEDS